ncbi:1823_t:CDS:2, partial [Acaulospora colombiana]
VDDGTEYTLAEDPEEWYAWKRAQDERRAQWGTQPAKGQNSHPAGEKQAAKPSAPENNKPKNFRSYAIHKLGMAKKRSARQELCWDEHDNPVEVQLRTRPLPPQSHTHAQPPASPKPASKSTKNSSQNDSEQLFRLASRNSSSSRISRSPSTSKYPPQTMALMTPVSSSMSRSQSLNRRTGSRTPVRGSAKGSQNEFSQRGVERSSQSTQAPLQPRIERAPARNSLEHSQVESNFQSPTTTDYLYGSQKSNQPVSSVKQPDSYIEELEEESRRIDMQRRTRHHSTIHTSRHNAWHLHSNDDEDTHCQSQQARDISNIVGEDLGEFFRNENYEALRQRYTDPSDVAY